MYKLQSRMEGMGAGSDGEGDLSDEDESSEDELVDSDNVNPLNSGSHPTSVEEQKSSIIGNN